MRAAPHTGQDVFVVGFFPPPITGQGIATERLAELLEETCAVHRVNLRENEAVLDLRVGRNILRRVAAYGAALGRLKKALRGSPDATVFWCSISPQPLGHLRDVLTVLPAFRRTQRVFAVVHWGSFARLYTSRWTRWTARWMLRRLRGVVFLTPGRAKPCARWIPDGQRFIIPNTLDPAVVCTDEEIDQKLAAIAPGRPLRLLFVSNMIREKGYLDVLEAIRIVAARGVAVHATFAGQWLDERDRTAFEAGVTHHGLEDTITHLGAIRDRKVIRTLHLEADVFLLPSYLEEAQPLTLIEAMNAGNPIITTRIGGMGEMIEDGQEGLFAPPRDPEALATAIARLADPVLRRRMAASARERFLRTYSPDQVRASWLALLLDDE